MATRLRKANIEFYIDLANSAAESLGVDTQYQIYGAYGMHAIHEYRKDDNGEFTILRENVSGFGNMRETYQFARGLARAMESALDSKPF